MRHDTEFPLALARHLSTERAALATKDSLEATVKPAIVVFDLHPTRRPEDLTITVQGKLPPLKEMPEGFKLIVKKRVAQEMPKGFDLKVRVRPPGK